MLIKIDSAARRQALDAANNARPETCEPLRAENAKLAPAVNTALAAVNGRATAFRVTSWTEVLALANRAENILEARGVPKPLRAGTRCVFRAPGPVAKAYKYNVTVSLLRLERGAADWYLVAIETDSARPGAPECFRLEVPLAAHDAIVAHALRGIDVVSLPREA
jgi:hypothetical protein